MPLNRYQIRNEYSLADPELYKAADKDDPEALLEGVAMAGLVGLLRQLGDLAEFAAEIFHDLHEEVMATAARGHSLTVRVQQLEAEFPLIERAFLAQTNHSSFFYNTGTDWHPNLRMEQNMVTQGDLPRFVMDSYEECRGPPRLFLLDKFDVAGAGACLKRYTDPSCFKVELSSYAFTASDGQREKKTRKTKKRGSRWRNGETPEVLPTSHAKLHQLFMEERIENGVNIPTHRMKLKRKLNGFPFDPKIGKSYMNKFLEAATSPEHKVVHEICVDSSPLRLTSSDAYENMLDTKEIRALSPDKGVMQRYKRAPPSPSPPQDDESYALKPCVDEVGEDPSGDEVQEISRERDHVQSVDILPNIVEEKEITMDGERQIEASIGYESDDVASEIDNYVDALTTMESELDTDTEQKAKRDLRFLNSRRTVSSRSSSSEKFHAQSSDSQSMENSTLSDDANSYSKKEISSFSCSDSPSASAESVLLEREVSSKEVKTFDSSCDRESVDEEIQSSQPPEHGDSDKKGVIVAEEPNSSCDSAEETTNPSVTDVTPMPVHAYAGIFVEVAEMRPETNDKFVTDDKSENPSNSNAEDAANLCVGSPAALDALEQNMNDSPSRASIQGKAVDYLVDGTYASYPSDDTFRTSNYLSDSRSLEIQHESKSDSEHMYLVDNLPFASNGSSQEKFENLSSDKPLFHHLDSEDPSSGEDPTCLYNLSDGPSPRVDDISPSFLAAHGLNGMDNLDEENPNGNSDASDEMLTISGTSEKDSGEHSWLTTSHDRTAEDTCIAKPNNLVEAIEVGNADEEHEETHGTLRDAVTSEQEDPNKNCGVDDADSLGSLSPKISEIANDVQSLEPKNEISCSGLEDVTETSSIMDFGGNGDILPSKILSAFVSSGLNNSPHLESLTKEALPSDGSDNKIVDRSYAVDETASLAASVNKGDKDGLSSLDQENFSDDSVCLAGHSIQNELVLDHNHLYDSPAESKLEKPISSLDMTDSFGSNSSENDASKCHHPEAEVCDTLSDTEFYVGAENTLDLNTASSDKIKNVNDYTECDSSLQTVSVEKGTDESEDDLLNEELMDKADVSVDQSSLMVQMQPSNDVDGAFEASSESLLANLPRQVATTDVFAHSCDSDSQPLFTDCVEKRAEPAIHEHDEVEMLDTVEAGPKPLAQLARPKQVDFLDLEQSAEASSISLSVPGPSQPSFPELFSQNSDGSFSSELTRQPDKEEDTSVCKDLDKERLVDEGVAKLEFLPQLDETQLSNHAGIVGALNGSSIPSMENIHTQPSLANPLPLPSHGANPFELGNTMISTSPGFVLLPGEPQMALAETPPLPPLPPIQWRLGKIQSSFDLDRGTPHHVGANPFNLAPWSDQIAHPVNRNAGLVAVPAERTELVDLSSADTLAQSGQHNDMQQPGLHALTDSRVQHANLIPDVTSLDRPSSHALSSSEGLIQPKNQVTPESLSKEQVTAHLEGNLPVGDGIEPKAAPLDTEHTGVASESVSEEQGTALLQDRLPLSDGIKPKATPPDIELTDSSESLFNGQSQLRPQSQFNHHPLHQLAPENISNLEETSTRLGRNVVIPDAAVHLPYAENERPDHSIPTTEVEIIWPAVEESNANGIRPVKLQRPRTPLIDDLATHDKSKLRKVTERVRPEAQKVDERDSLVQLRKVTERVRPEAQKVDERDSLLEQIRKKSFNLKPTVATRPSTQGPQTNLRVAAILEKAKTIRQAFAGSDEEDDDDSWSDS